VGLFDSLRQRRLEREAIDAASRYAELDKKWQEKNKVIDDMIAIVDDCLAGKVRDQFRDDNGYGFILKKDEFPVAYLTDIGYIEIVKAPNRYSGGYGGVSFPIFGGIRMNTGRIGGSAIEGAEGMKMTDEGNALVTNKRIMYAGGTRSHEWRFDKMLSVSHLAGGISFFAMNTGKPTGIGYGTPNEREIQFRIEIAAAMATETMDRFRKQLQVEKDKLTSEMPVPPPPVAPLHG
jgi:hypothetical protein